MFHYKLDLIAGTSCDEFDVKEPCILDTLKVVNHFKKIYVKDIKVKLCLEPIYTLESIR